MINNGTAMAVLAAPLPAALPEYDIWLLRLKPILVKKILNYVAMCNWFVISFPLMLRDLGK